MEKEREQQVYLAKLAEQAERYDGIPPPPLAVRLHSSRSFIFIAILVPSDETAFVLSELVSCLIFVHCGSETAKVDLFLFYAHSLWRSSVE